VSLTRRAALLIALTVPAIAKKKPKPPRRWQEGRVLDMGSRTQENGTYAGPLGGGAIAVPLRSTWQYYTIQSKTVQYYIAENAGAPANVLVNGHLDFAIERGKFYFVDMDKFEHVAVILRQALLP
jgi:hypothetical protein